MANWPVGILCGTCHQRRRRNPKPCSQCGNTRVMAGRALDGRDQCGPCAGVDTLHVACRRCGFPGDLYQDGCCTRCVATDRINDLLSREDGTLVPQLVPLRDALCTARSAESILKWASGRTGARLLAQLVTANLDLTHAVLDGLPQDHTVRYVRALLVGTGILPWRNENFARLVNWFATTADELPLHQSRFIRPFAEWRILRDARRRAGKGPYSAGAATADRTEIRVAVTFLTWLDTRQLTLGTVAQEDLDLWVTTHPTQRRHLAPFIHWTVARRLTGPLEIMMRANALPSRFLTEDDQHEQLRRCLNDTNLPLDIRIIGAFVRLYAQQVSRIVEFTTDRFQRTDGKAYFVFGTHPVLLPPKLADLVQQQIEQPVLRATVVPQATGGPTCSLGDLRAAPAARPRSTTSCASTACRPSPHGTQP